jgi:hypothetical protein
MAVWGRAYVDKFLTIALPTLLAPDNLPSAVTLASSRFLIVTSEADVAVIRDHALFIRLAELLQVSFATFEPNENRYKALSTAHWIAAESASTNGEAAVFLAPDAIAADGSLSHVVRVAREGARAVMVTGLRLVEEAVTPILRTLPRDENGALSLAPRPMTKLALTHLHSEIEQYIWGTRDFTGSPHLCMWPGPNHDGFLIRAFHLHPLLVDFEKAKDFSSLKQSTIDGNFLGHVIGKWSDIHIVDDSDDVSIYSLTPSAQRWQYRTFGAATTGALRGMAYSGLVNPLHRHFFTAAVRLHAEDLDEQWAVLEEDTGRLAYEVLDLDAGERLSAAIQQMAGRKLLEALAIKLTKKIWPRANWHIRS